MKYLDIQSFVSINRELDVVSTGDCVISGRLEAYSCKTVGSDKKLYKEIQTELSKSPNYSSFHSYSKSPSSSFSSSYPSKSPTSTISKSPSSTFHPHTVTKDKDSSSSNNNEDNESKSPTTTGQNTSINSELATSPHSSSSMMVGPSMKTFVYLIATLNASFLDYDFSNASPEQFKREPNRHMVMNSINTTLSASVPNYNTELKDKLWASVDVEVDLFSCDIYSYIPDLSSDPFSEAGIIWSFNYFFYGKAVKRIIFFTCRAVSKAAFEQQPGKSSDTLLLNKPLSNNSDSDSGDENQWAYEEAIIGTMEFDNTTFAP